jgi:hypothetical protein
MKKQLLLIAASFFVSHLVWADTSYLLVQGPFGSTGSVETFEWKVIYPHGSLTTGIDLLGAVFGKPTDTGNLYEGTYEIFSASNNLKGASFIDFGTGGSSLFTISYTLDNKTVQQDDAFSPGWNYYVAGGAGGNHGGAYDNTGAWTYSDDGTNSRALSDGSFDAWSFGATFPPDPIAGGTGADAPTTPNFAGATVVNVVPEPASLTFLSLGALLLIRRRR